ncbi:hypothetical protein [Desulfoscipio gibsoniae]|nr:hypothetical protein [Desulfoscipio gibsoniae]
MVHKSDIREKKVKIPKTDTHPGTGLHSLDGKVQDVDPRELLGEE